MQNFTKGYARKNYRRPYMLLMLIRTPFYGILHRRCACTGVNRLYNHISSLRFASHQAAYSRFPTSLKILCSTACASSKLSPTVPTSAKPWTASASLATSSETTFNIEFNSVSSRPRPVSMTILITLARMLLAISSTSMRIHSRSASWALSMIEPSFPWISVVH